VADLDAIHQAIRTCGDCTLCETRTNAVPGEGSPHAEIMFIGEGPGFNEDKQARPFVGAAGQFLNELLASIGLRREDVFITNMVKCRPPNNRDPFPGEIEECSKYLDAQIEIIAPKIIVPLGRHALSRWFPNDSIGRLRAKPRVFGEITLFPLYHPAAALHNGGLRSTIEEDFAKLAAHLVQLGAAPGPPQPAAQAAPPQPAAQAAPPGPAAPAAPVPPSEAPEPAAPREAAAEPEPPGQQLRMF
jgi:DNA polymerase